MAAARAVPPKAEAVADRFSGNPIRRGWYATPDAAISGKQYRIHPTYSAAYEKQLVFGASSSPDLVTWTKHLHVLDTGAVSWVKKALWAPAIAQKEGKYYLLFPPATSTATAKPAASAWPWPTGRRARAATCWTSR